MAHTQDEHERLFESWAGNLNTTMKTVFSRHFNHNHVRTIRVFPAGLRKQENIPAAGVGFIWRSSSEADQFSVITTQ